MSKLFIKNYYYNRKSLIKLIYMYNYLNNISFLEELISMIMNSNFSLNERKTEVLFEIYSKLLPAVIKLDLNFGFVWIFEEKMVFYFKEDCDFNDFYFFFENLENVYKMKWGCAEIFDKNTKIFEIFAKNFLLRSFRDEIVALSKKNKVTNVKETYIDFEKDKFLSFIEEYETKNVKIIVHFYKKED